MTAAVNKNTLEDLMFLLGYEPKQKNVTKKWIRDIETDAETAWIDGKNADKNPYPHKPEKDYYSCK